MDDQVTVEELKEKVRAFCEERDWDQFHNAKDLAIGVATEAGELLDIFRFLTSEQVEELFESDKKDKIAEELADTLYFILRMSQLYGIELSQSLDKKIKKNAIKYPVKSSKGSNLKYTETH